LSEKAAQKKLAIIEMVESEKTYLKNLQILIKDFFIPLKKSPSYSPEPFISNKDIATLFGNLEAIVDVTQKMYEQLEKEQDNIASVFIKMYKQFTPYIEYVANFDHSIARYEKLRQKSQFMDFIQICISKTGATLDLGGYLIQPVQRPPRYRLLLETLIKYTPLDDAQYTSLLEALNCIKKMNDEINQHKRELDNRYKFANIKKRVEGLPDDLYDFKRLFIREGPLECFSKKTKSLFNFKQSCYLFLFTDVCLKTKPQRKADRYVFEELIKLNPPIYNIVEVDQPKEFGFKLFRKDIGEEEFIFFSPTERDNKFWMIDFENAIQVLEVKALCDTQ